MFFKFPSETPKTSLIVLPVSVPSFKIFPSLIVIVDPAAALSVNVPVFGSKVYPHPGKVDE